MLKIIKQLYYKKKLVVFIPLFMIAIFLLPTSIANAQTLTIDNLHFSISNILDYDYNDPAYGVKDRSINEIYNMYIDLFNNSDYDYYYIYGGVNDTLPRSNLTLFMFNEGDVYSDVWSYACIWDSNGGWGMKIPNIGNKKIYRYTYNTNKIEEFNIGNRDGYTQIFPCSRYVKNNHASDFYIPILTNYDGFYLNFQELGYSYFKNIKINDVNYVPGVNNISVIPFSNDTINVPKQVYSVDFNLNNKDYTQNKFKIKIDRVDNINNIRASAFKFYGLKNNNGLFNWEELKSNLTGCAVDDYNDFYNSNSYTFEVFGLTSACNNLFNNYEKLIFKIIFNNAYDIDNITTSGSSFYLNGYSDKHIIEEFNTADFKYINFTTTLDQYSNFYDFNIDPGHDIFLHLFNTQTKEFKEYGVYARESGKNHKYYLNIGQKLNAGFWLTYNIPIKPEDITNFKDFKFKFGYIPEYLYYSMVPRDGTRLNENAIIVDGNGNPIITNLKPTDDIVLIYYKFENISDLFKVVNKFMSNNNRIITEIGSLTNYFFINLNEHIRSSLIAVYSALILCAIILNTRR